VQPVVRWTGGCVLCSLATRAAASSVTAASWPSIAASAKRHGARAVLRQGEREAGAMVARGRREAAALRAAARHRRQLDRPAAESR
jgi:hypothetical protein